MFKNLRLLRDDIIGVFPIVGMMGRGHLGRRGLETDAKLTQGRPIELQDTSGRVVDILRRHSGRLSVAMRGLIIIARLKKCGSVSGGWSKHNSEGPWGRGRANNRGRKA